MTRNQRHYSLDGFSSSGGCRSSNQDDGEVSEEEPAVMGVMSMG